jgi:hypothetical protein
MPVYNIEPKKSVEVARATFHKESDYKVVTLNSDKTKKQRLLHVIQADRLIKNKKATEVKNANLEGRDVEHLTETPVRKGK